MKKILVLGLGNEILSDDGIAPRLIKDLSESFSGENFDFEACSCGGLEIPELIQGYRQAVLIDAISLPDTDPGDVLHFVPEDFKETSNLSNLHDINFITALSLGKTLGIDMPDDIHIIAIKIVEDSEFSEKLSPEIEKIYPEILMKVKILIAGISGIPAIR